MSVIWINDGEVTGNCDYCGETDTELFKVDDSDLSVGYHGEMEVCAECRRRYELKRRMG